MIYLCYLMNCSKQTEMFMIIIHEAPTSYIKDTIEQIMDDSLYHPKALTNGMKLLPAITPLTLWHIVRNIQREINSICLSNLPVTNVIRSAAQHLLHVTKTNLSACSCKLASIFHRHIRALSVCVLKTVPKINVVNNGARAHTILSNARSPASRLFGVVLLNFGTKLGPFQTGESSRNAQV